MSGRHARGNGRDARGNGRDALAGCAGERSGRALGYARTVREGERSGRASADAAPWAAQVVGVGRTPGGTVLVDWCAGQGESQVCDDELRFARDLVPGVAEHDESGSAEA
jgi:hypothetical protein